MHVRTRPVFEIKRKNLVLQQAKGQGSPSGSPLATATPAARPALHAVRTGETAFPAETNSPNSPMARVSMLNPSEFRVLVINSSQEMAKEITGQLNLNLPGCAITYAPSIELARWILQRRPIDLIVSNPILPDGSISRLQDVLKKAKSPPDLLVIGSAGQSTAALKSIGGYRFSTYRSLGESPTASKGKQPPAGVPAINMDRSIKDLGADLRNDLNNPLQEIVAMVYVAKAAGSSSAGTSQALDAIDQAAKNMAKVVKGLEDKIREAVRS